MYPLHTKQADKASVPLVDSRLLHKLSPETKVEYLPPTTILPGNRFDFKTFRAIQLSIQTFSKLIALETGKQPESRSR